MGGYMTNHGILEMSRAQIILEGLARREDEIFRRRREGLSFNPPIIVAGPLSHDCLLFHRVMNLIVNAFI
jgi:hypothetical protein